MRRLAALPLLLLVAACTAAPPSPPRLLPPPATLPATLPGAPPTTWATLPDGTRLALNVWRPAGPPRGVILALHGFGDAGELAFGPAADAWAARGLLVYAPDQRGFGANPSRRDWPGPARLVEDARTLAAGLRARHPGLPLTVVGHSMGGGIAVAAAAEGFDVDRIVLAGPAITAGAAITPLARASLSVLAAVMPEHRWSGGGLVRIRATDNDAALARAIADPRSFGDPSSRELRGLVDLMDRAEADAPRNPWPTLTLAGARDEVIDPAAVVRVAATLPCRAGVILYPDGWHWLFLDHQAPKVWADVASFALASDVPCTAGPDHAAPPG